jgi:hypothetical protein
VIFLLQPLWANLSCADILYSIYQIRSSFSLASTDYPKYTSRLKALYDISFQAYFLWWGVVFKPDPNTGGPPLVRSPQLFIQYIRRYSPHLQANSTNCNLRTYHAVMKRDSHEFTTVFKIIKYYNVRDTGTFLNSNWSPEQYRKCLLFMVPKGSFLHSHIPIMFLYPKPKKSCPNPPKLAFRMCHMSIPPAAHGSPKWHLFIRCSLQMFVFNSYSYVWYMTFLQFITLPHIIPKNLNSPQENHRQALPTTWSYSVKDYVSRYSLM